MYLYFRRVDQVKRLKILGCMPRFGYNVIVVKLDGTFDVPLEKRTPDQQWALCWLRKRNYFTLDCKSEPHCHGKRVTNKEDIPEYVRKGLKDTHGCSLRVLYYKLKELYQDLVRETYLEFCPRNITFTSSSLAL